MLNDDDDYEEHDEDAGCVRPAAVPSLRHLWAFSRFPDHMGFLVQWEMDAVPQAPPTASGAPANQAASSPAPPVSQFAVEWRTEGRDSVSSWTRVDNTLAIIQGTPQLAIC